MEISEASRIHVRRSTGLRLGYANPTEFETAISAFEKPDEQQVMQFDFEGISGGADLLSVLTSEYLGLLDSIARTMPEFAEGWGCSLLQELHLDDDRRLGARIEWPTGELRIKLSLGLCLAIDDALLMMLCVLGFFRFRPGPEDRVPGQAIAHCGETTPTRYVDYSATYDLDDGSIAAALTSSMPLDPLRLVQGETLLTFALAWIALHEQAHDQLGHVAWMRSGDRTNRVELGEAKFFEGSSEAERNDSFCLELQADALATQMFFTHGMSEAMAAHAWIARYQSGIQEYACGRNAWAPDLATREGRFHAMLLAACVGVLLFEMRRERLRQPSVSHPPPATRILGILVCAVSAWADVAEFEQGLTSMGENEYPLDILRPAAKIANTVLLELDLGARAIGLQSSQYRSRFFGSEGEGSDTRDRFSPIADDFYRLLAGTENEATMMTEAGKTYVSLLARSKSLYDEIDKFCKVSGFR